MGRSGAAPRGEPAATGWTAGEADQTRDGIVGREPVPSLGAGGNGAEGASLATGEGNVDMFPQGPRPWSPCPLVGLASTHGENSGLVSEWPGTYSVPNLKLRHFPLPSS